MGTEHNTGNVFI